MPARAVGRKGGVEGGERQSLWARMGATVKRWKKEMVMFEFLTPTEKLMSSCSMHARRLAPPKIQVDPTVPYVVHSAL